ncbi:LysR family transcriptional regulator [Nitrosomonas sp.]|uniref:LysR family transcriptional regulator n=1 Tax=Nitrosomonas sp. TaxID=42353 RepID=UPI0026008E43|nr:LysR family transcriptional regulator [Nitrosomonas sp.]
MPLRPAASVLQRMHLSKSIVSQRIKDLEAVLGVKLLHRSTCGVTVTDKGAIFYQHTRTIMLQLDRASEELAEQENRLCAQIYPGKV